MAHPLLTIHTDGASRGNPGAAAYAFVIARAGLPVIEEADCLGQMTNNQAEYTALVRALERALELGAEADLIIHSDSELMVKQMRGEYRVKNEDLRDLYKQALELSGRFLGKVTFKHVRREMNQRADELGNEALDGRPRPRRRLEAEALERPEVLTVEQEATQLLESVGVKDAAGVWQKLAEIIKRHGYEMK